MCYVPVCAALSASRAFLIFFGSTFFIDYLSDFTGFYWQCTGHRHIQEKSNWKKRVSFLSFTSFFPPLSSRLFFFEIKCMEYNGGRGGKVDAEEKCRLSLFFLRKKRIKMFCILHNKTYHLPKTTTYSYMCAQHNIKSAKKKEKKVHNENSRKELFPVLKPEF